MITLMHYSNLFRAAIIALVLLLSGCDAINCIINNHPEFSKTSLNQATLNQVYEESITASISNSIEDRKYDYEITLEGELPEGLEFQSSGSEITFTGTPIELGTFPIKLKVVAKPKFFSFPEDDAPEDLCSDTETRTIELLVVQEF